ncbi:MAG: hypothetical protein IJM29_04535 [Bacteroidales bacterium]|nr:hypothetical protein [Bacteroidales bacterium]
MNREEVLIYYRQQEEAFTRYVFSMLSALDKYQEDNYDKMTSQQKKVLTAMKSLFIGGLVTDIQKDLATGNVTTETVEKRVKLEQETWKIIKKMFNRDPIWDVFLELLFNQKLQLYRNSLLQQVKALSYRAYQ